MYNKLIAALTAAVGVLATTISDGISATEWVSIALAFLGALGVYAVANKPA